MFAQLVLLAAAQVSSPMVDAYDRITLQVAAERVARCGAGLVTIRTDKEIQVDVLVVATKGPIPNEQIVCIAKAASFYDVELPPDAQPRLNAITEARSAALVKAEGEKWLVAHKLGKLPEYKAGVTDDDGFARKIEKLCNADGALHSQYGVHALNPEWAARQQGGLVEDGPFACVISVALASGFKFGFIGNERFTP